MSELAEKLFGAAKAIADGVGKAVDFAQSSPALNDMVNHGRTEIAAGLFGGQSNAYVMYQKGTHDQPKEPSVEVQNPEITQSRGRGM